MDWPAVALVASVLLAGCSGFAASDRSTLTPAPVPEGPTSVAPGLADGRVVSPAALARAHERVLADVSYTLVLRWQVGDQERETLLRVENGSRYRYRGERLTESYSQQVYADGGVQYRREQRPLGVRYDRYESPPNAERFGRITGRLVETYLPEGPAGTTQRADGTEVVVGRPPADTEGMANYTVRAVVTPRGLVRSFVLSYRDVTREVPVRYRFRYTNVGETTVNQPDWVDEHWNESAPATPTTAAAGEE